MPKIHVFTDADLDGAGSYLALKLAYKNADISYSVTTEKNFRENILNWQLKDSFKNYDTVFICDLNIKNDIALIDRDNVVVFDHHAEHVNHLNEYVKAKAIIKEYPSCTLLMYHSLKLKEKITDHQKLLFNFISDYDSYVLKYPQSRELNQIFWNYTGDRLQKFLIEFKDGFFGFNRYHKNALKIVERNIENYFKTQTLYKGNLKISGKDYNVMGGFFSFSPNEIAERALRENNADVILLINLKSKTVCYRKSKTCDLDVGKLAEKLADGGGHEAAAGSLLNDTIINITKLLQPIEL